MNKRNNFINVEKNANLSIEKKRAQDAAAIQLIAVDSDMIMMQGDIDTIADSIAEFLLQNYLNGGKIEKAS